MCPDSLNKQYEQSMQIYKRMFESIGHRMPEFKDDLTPTPQFKELFNIYTEQLKELKQEEDAELRSLQRQMKDYLEVAGNREEIESKLHNLKYKMGFAAKIEKEECECANS